MFIRLLINSERLTTRVEYVNAAGQHLQVSCVDIESGVRRAFDKRCDLVSPMRGVSDVRILPKRYEREMDPIAFKLVYGG